MSDAIDAFAAEMQLEFDDLLNGALLSKIGTAEDFDFDGLLRRFRRWRVVPSSEVAVFCCDSITSQSAGTGMLNESIVGGVSTALNDAMRRLIQRLRPGFDDKWLAFCASSRFGEEFRWDLVMPGDFMGYCREVLALRKGMQTEGFFQDLIAVYRAGFMPCGWDGDFPEGDLLLY